MPLFPFENVLAYLVQVSCADSEHNVTGVRDGAQRILQHLEGRAEDRAVYLPGQRRRGYTYGVLLTRGEYLREEEYVCAFELLHKIVKQRRGA